MRHVLVLALAASLAAADDFLEVDYGEVARTIAKEPRYLSAPRYALFVLDPAGRFRVWAVADRSKESKHFDILYMDLDGDGALTEAGERFEGRADPKLAAAGMEMSIRVGDIPVPGTKIVHTKFLVSTRNAFEALFAGLPCTQVGEITEDPSLIIQGQKGERLVQESIFSLKRSWQQT